MSAEPLRAEIEYAGIPVTFALPSTDDHIARILRDTRTFYEKAMLSALAPSLQAGDLVIDAGANIGNHALFFSKICGCRVIAFEPISVTANLLRENVRANGVEDKVQVMQVALGEGGGMARIASSDPANLGGTTLAVDAGGEIEVRSLDQIDIGHPVRLIKVDVEGMDLAVLKGARALLARDRPWVLCEAGTAKAFEEIRDFLAAQSYTPTAVYNATDTYLFLPSATQDERTRLVEQGFQQMMSLQRESREISGRIAQAGRYSERLKAEAVAESSRRFDAWKKERAAQMHEVAGGETLPFDEVRDVMVAFRDQAAAELADVRRQLDACRAEGAVLAERAAEAQRLVEERSRQLASARSRLAALEALPQRVASLDEALARQTRAAEASQQQLTKANGRVGRQEKELAALEQQLSKAKGLAGRQERQLAALEQQLSKAKSLVAQQKQQIEQAQSLRRASEDALRTLQASRAFRFVVLLRDGLRSPRRALLLPRDVLRLLRQDRRKER